VETERDNRRVQNVRRNRLLKKYNIQKEDDLNPLIEALKQKVSAKTQRLARYKKKQNQYYQNKLFRTDCKKFYNRLRQIDGNVQNAPDKKEVENFWREIYGNKIKNNGEVRWIKNQY
jgi:hypothetical protein